MIKLNVPYFSQLGNDAAFFGSGSRQCNLTAHAMAAEFILSNRGMESLSQRAKQFGLIEPESAYGEILNKYGDTIDHTANGLALKELGLDNYWSTKLSFKDAIASLDKELPMPIGVYYKSSGHIICLVGYGENFFWVHDPYGSRSGENDYYQEIGSQSGKYEKYSFGLMRKLWSTGSDGWGRVFL